MELVALCRTGFEKEVAAELAALAAAQAVTGYPKTRDGQGYVEFVCGDFDALAGIMHTVAFTDLIFIRDWFISPGELVALNPSDRVTPFFEQFHRVLAARVDGISEWVYLNVDSNEGKALAKLIRGVGGHLKRRVALQPSAGWQAVLLLTRGDAGFLGVCPVVSRPRWSGGVAHLKLPREAPSRATLKLEEAWHHFIPAGEWENRLQPGMRAVDLGAAPGGWTWQLVARSMFVEAVDNGPMAGTLMDSGQVRHHRLDGFAYVPSTPVDWLVCDIADKPARVADMIATWGEQGWCREAVFNLKLPMKQRYKEVLKCADTIQQRLWAAGRDHQLRFKQLYHDREEVTGHLRLIRE